MSAVVDLELPCFFSIAAGPRGRIHRGFVVAAPEIRAESRSPDQAAHQLADAVRTRCDRRPEDLPALLRIPPEATVHAESLQATWKDRRRELTLRLLRFRLGAREFALVPRMGAVLAIPAGGSAAARADATQAALDAWVRARREELLEDEREEEPWSDRRGDRVIWIRVRVRARWPALRVEEPDPRLSVGPWGPVDGQRELGLVSKPLGARWPDGLLLDRIPDPRVDGLRRWLFEDDAPTPIALVGPSGCGKTTLVHAAVRRELDHVLATDPRRAERLAHVHHLDPARIIAGQSVIGAWERRLLAILEHLVDPSRQRARDALYVDRPVALARVGRSAGSALTLTTVLRPWLERRRLPFLVEATPEQWTQLEELDRPFADLFRVVRLPAPTPDQVADVLLANLEAAEATSGCAGFTGPALRALVDLDRRYPGGRGQPGGVVDRAHLAASRAGGEVVDDLRVRAMFEDTTGLRPEWVDRARPLPDEPLRARIGSRLVGQPEAVHAIADLVHVLRAGMARPGRPLAAWLLVGPTGVGKTEAARVLADLWFRTRERLVRLDLNEYADAGAVTRLLGDGAQEGHLTGRLRGGGVVVLLLDEIEKAHPAVVDLLLQVLDEGRITDAAGRTADLTRAAILITSNVGASELAATAGFGRDAPSAEALRATFRSAVERSFRPELVNRLDRILVFGTLSRADAGEVAKLQLAAVLAREGFLRRTVLVDLEPAALDRLVERGFDPASGGRALQRSLEEGVATGVAHQLASVPLDRPLVLTLRDHGGEAREAKRPPFDAPNAGNSRSTPSGVEPAPVEGGRQKEVLRGAERSFDVRAEARLLSFAERRVLEAPAEEVVTEAELRGLREALPDPGPLDGTDPRGVAIVRLREHLDRALRAFDEEEPDAELEQRHLADLYRRGRREGKAPRPRWRRAPVRWMDVVSFRSAREFLVDRAAGPADELPEAVQLPLLRQQVRALREGSPAPVEVRLQGVVDDGPATWAAFQGYVDALEAAVALLGGVTEVERHTGSAWVPVGAVPAAGARRIRVRGASLGEALAAEVGVHLWYPEEGTPVGLRVSLPDRAADDTVVRLLVAGSGAEDLPTGVAGLLSDVLPAVWRLSWGSP